MDTCISERVVTTSRGSSAAAEGVDEPSVYGFRVRCDQDLRFLRSGQGVETLQILTASAPRSRPNIEPLADWAIAGTSYDARATLYRVDDGFEFWTTDTGAYHIDPVSGRIEIPAECGDILREQRLWGIPTMLCYMHRGDFPLHAAAVQIGSGAVLLAAPSKFGKTTLAFAFHRRGYRVLSEDLVCCRASATCEVLPGPALMRLRPDVFDGGVPPGTLVMHRQADRLYLAPEPGCRGTSGPVPIVGIVFLRESTDGVRIERAAPAVALADLWHLNFRVPAREHRARSFEQLAKLAGSVSSWNVYRPFQLSLLEETVTLLATHFGNA